MQKEGVGKDSEIGEESLVSEKQQAGRYAGLVVALSARKVD